MLNTQGLVNTIVIVASHIEPVTPPLSGAALPSTWAERDAVPQRKDYIIDRKTH